MQKVGYKPREVDEMEVWECAIALGVEDTYEQTKRKQSDLKAVGRARTEAYRRGEKLTWADVERMGI